MSKKIIISLFLCLNIFFLYGCNGDILQSKDNSSSVENIGGNTGGDTGTGGDNTGNTGGNESGNTSGDNTGNTGDSEGGNTDSGNTGDGNTDGDNTGDGETGNTDGDDGNTGGVVGGDGNEGGSSEGNAGGSVDLPIEQLPNIPPLTAETQRYIILNANGGTGGNNGYEYKVMDIENTTDIPLNKFTRSGYEFLGWSEDKDATDPDYADGALYTVMDNSTLYAVWGNINDIVTVTIDFNGGNNIGMPSKFSFRKGGSAVLPDIAAEKNGLIPVGFNTVSDNMTAKYFEGDKYSDETHTTLYVTFTDGRCEDCKGKTLWMKGVNASSNESDWVDYYGGGSKTLKWEEGKSNWFDIYQYQYNMCWAATASNLLLWWQSQNKKYIDAYDSSLNSKFTYYFDTSDGKKFGRYAHSYLFEKEFRDNWDNVGGQQNAGINWFLFGQKGRADGAYFKDVFEGKVMTRSFHNLNKVRFNYYVTDALKNDRGISFGIMNPSSHAITGWGAKYDDEGFIEVIYTSNSQTYSDTQTGEAGGLDDDTVHYKDDKSYPVLGGIDKTTYVLSVYTFSLGQEYWEEYFAKKGKKIE